MQTDQKYSIRELLARIEANWSHTATIENAVVLGLVRLSELALDKSRERLAPLGLTQAGFEVLTTLRSLPKPRQLTPTELYRSILITSGGMTKVLHQLEAQGYIERLGNPADKRSTFVRLTDKGEDFAEVSMKAVASGDREVLRGALDEKDLEMLRDLLLRALAKIET